MTDKNILPITDELKLNKNELYGAYKIFFGTLSYFAGSML